VAYRLAVTTMRHVWSSHRVLSLLVIFCTLVCWVGPACGDEPAGPDTEAFQGAKQIFFRNPQQAVEQFRDFIRKYPDSEWTSEAYYWLAKSMETSKADRSEVIKAYTTFLDLYPKHKLADEAAFAIAEVYRNRRTGNSDLEKALERYDRFIEMYPKSDRVPEAWFKMGDVQAALRHYDKALEAYGKVIGNCPKSSFVLPARIGEADSLSRMAEYDKALPGFNSLLTESLTDWDRLRVRLGLLNIYLKTKKIEEAKAEAERIRAEADKQGHQQDSAALSSYRMIADYYQQTKEYDKALDEMTAYMERFPNSDGVWTARSLKAEIYLSAGKPVEARKEFAEILKDHPKAKDKNPPDTVLGAWYRTAYTYEVEKNIPEAIRQYQQLAETYPDNYRGKAARKRADELNKQLEEQKAKEKKPDEKKPGEKK
jgi:TolA-binding protein